MMKKIAIVEAGIVALLLPLISAGAAGRTALKAGTWEIGNSSFRASQVKAGKMTPARLWCNSAEAVSAAILDSACDIIGVQALCDSISGRVQGAASLLDILNRESRDFEWLVLSNTNPNFPLDGPVSNGTAVIWKASRFELKDYGINWLSGLYDKPGREKSLIYGSGYAAVVWVRLFDREAGREVVFASANVNGPTQYDKGKKVIYHKINAANCRNLVTMMKNEIVPAGTASVITLNARNSVNHEGYRELNSSVWFDVFDRLKEEGSLSDDDLKLPDTLNSPDESRIEGGRPDHILVDGFNIVSYKVLRRKYPCADGTMHYPSLHFPLVADLTY